MKCARKLSIFITWLLYVHLLGGQIIYGVVINSPEMPIEMMHIGKHRYASVSAHTQICHIKSRYGKLLMHQRVSKLKQLEMGLGQFGDSVSAMVIANVLYEKRVFSKCSRNDGTSMDPRNSAANGELTIQPSYNKSFLK